MPDETPALALEEYRALRATIRERGTARVAIAASAIVAWAALAVAVQALSSNPVATLVPLLVLAVCFEAVYTLHIGVERIGRYLQVHFETSSGQGPPAWERVAMRHGQQGAGARSHIDPLFAPHFAVATLINFVPVARISLEGVAYGALHVLFILRVVQARRFAAVQRERDLEFFSQVRPGSV